MDELLSLISLSILLLSVIGIYNARSIVKSRGSFKDMNGSVKGFKVLCYISIILTIILLIYLNK